MRTSMVNTLDHIIAIASYSRNARDIVSVFLAELGCPPENIGFEFLMTAIILREKDPAGLRNESLYEAVAEHYNNRFSIPAIDGAMRRTLGVAWENGFEDAWVCYFPTMGNGIMKKPNNLAFIAYMSRLLEFALGHLGEHYEEVGNYGIE